MVRGWMGGAVLMGGILLGQSTPSEPLHTSLARKMIAGVKPASNAYVHRPLAWTLDGERSLFQGDCSGVVLLTFREGYRVTAENWKGIAGVGRPLATHLYDAVGPGRAFAPVARVEDLRVGDFFFIKYLTRPESGDTGHVLMVSSNYDPAWRSGKGSFSVPVIDSSKSPHGTSDTRNRGPREPQDLDGLGEGLFGLRTDGAGVVVAHAWTPRSTNVRPVSTHPLVMARWQGLSNAGK